MVWGYIFGTCLLLDIVGNFTLDGVIPDMKLPFRNHGLVGNFHIPLGS